MDEYEGEVLAEKEKKAKMREEATTNPPAAEETMANREIIGMERGTFFKVVLREGLEMVGDHDLASYLMIESEF